MDDWSCWSVGHVFLQKTFQMKSAVALRRNQILMIQMRTMPLQYHPSWHRCWTNIWNSRPDCAVATMFCSGSCLQTNQSLFLPKSSAGAEWNAEFQAVKRCSGLGVSKVYLEALGEWQVICAEKKHWQLCFRSMVVRPSEIWLVPTSGWSEAEESFVVVYFNFWVQLIPTI